MRLLLASLLLLCLVAPGCASRAGEDPAAARIVTEDVTRFWHAWDLAGQASTKEEREAIFQREYLDAGSPGLRAFTELRIDNAAKLVAEIDKHPAYYAHLRARSQQVGRHEPAIRAALVRMAQLYPDAAFPDVYFLIGRMNSAGTLADAGLLVGLDMFGLDADAPRDELGDWHRAVLKSMDGLPHIVAHELVHFQQRFAMAGQPTLLQASLGEGIADLVAELASGAHINGHVHEWADPRFDALATEFRAAMHGTDYAGWLYDTSPGEGRPADLGYWMGYRIARAYYDRASDKQAAVREMLTIRDFEAFLEESGAFAALPEPASQPAGMAAD